MYPPKLPNHRTEKFYIENSCPKNNIFQRAYYHKDDYPLNMHAHNFYEINIITNGNGAHYIENNFFPTQTDDVFIIPLEVRHGYWSENNLIIFHLLLPHYILEKYAGDLEKFTGFYALFEIEPYIRKNYNKSIFLHLSFLQLQKIIPELDNLLSDLQEKDCLETDLIFETRSILLIEQLSYRINSNQQQLLNESAHLDALYILKTIEYIRLNYAEKISVDKLAKMASMSRSTFLRRFWEMCKTSPANYLSEIRVSQACLLLKNTDLTITEIAQNCGFFDCSHFIRIFTKSQGITPGVYRKKLISKKMNPLLSGKSFNTTPK